MNIKENTNKPPIKAENLYEPSRQLSKDDRKKIGMQVKATIYTQDPLVAKEHPKIGLSSIWVDWEPGLKDGPTSSRIAVVDYNADTDSLEKDYSKWDSQQWCFVDSKNMPVDGHQRNSPAFRQVNVWAIIQNILAFFEDKKVMGRYIPWAFEGNRLIVVPAAGNTQNAFYDRVSKSLQFYFCVQQMNQFTLACPMI